MGSLQDEINVEIEKNDASLAKVVRKKLDEIEEGLTSITQAQMTAAINRAHGLNASRASFTKTLNRIRNERTAKMKGSALKAPKTPEMASNTSEKVTDSNSQCNTSDSPKSDIGKGSRKSAYAKADEFIKKHQRDEGWE